MSRRIIAMILGGVVGVCVISFTGFNLGFSNTVALIGGGLLGMALGRVISLLCDVFLTPSGRMSHE